jgi:SAM-dependent methyltransferase
MAAILEQKAERLGVRASIDLHRVTIGEFRDSQSFDVIVAFGCFLNHCEHWEDVLAFLSEKLNPGGLLLFSIEKVFGAEEIWSVFSKANSGNKMAQLSALWDCLKSDVTGRTFSKSWTITVNGYKLSTELIYIPMKKIVEVLHRGQMKIRQYHGTNFLTCFFPWVLDSIDLRNGYSIQPEDLARLRRARSIDQRILQVWPFRYLAAQAIIVCQKQ